MKDKKAADALLVDVISSSLGHDDKAKANLFYCPREKRKWIAKGDSIVNPYLKDMRDCGERQ